MPLQQELFWAICRKNATGNSRLGMASFQFKHTIEGDVNVISPSDIALLLKKGHVK